MDSNLNACPSTPCSTAAADYRDNIKKRGSYNCGRCGLPKKGHVCNMADFTVSSSMPSFLSASRFPFSQRPTLRRALSFEAVGPMSEAQGKVELDFGLGILPLSCVVEVLKRLPPAGIAIAATVCKGWRDATMKIWQMTEEIKLRVLPKMHFGIVGSLLNKCPGLVRLSLRIESDLDATLLACVAFSCPNLEAMEISTSNAAINRISGDELGRFVADKQCLSSLKMEGCANMGSLVLYSSSLLTLWLSDLHSLSKMVFDCPNLKEVSLNFSCQDNDNTDLNAMMDGLGRCSRLQSIHISSTRINHVNVLALTTVNLRALRMLSLILGDGITDASVSAISATYSKLELLDLSGSSITDSGIGEICNALPGTLTRLLLALCPNVTSSGIQFAIAQLPLLEVMDCGMTIRDPIGEASENKLHHVHQKLLIKHSRMKKLSLWGCSGLDALYLNCPELNDLNLNSCSNLHPEKLLLQCPKLESVYASECQALLVGTIENQVSNNDTTECHVACKRLADGSKRVRAMYFSQQPCNEDKRKHTKKQRCNIIMN